MIESHTEDIFLFYQHQFGVWGKTPVDFLIQKPSFKWKTPVDFLIQKPSFKCKKGRFI